MAGGAIGARADVAACDAAAAHEYDRTRPASVRGLKFKDVDSARGVIACDAAQARHPAEARYKFQLARSYHRDRNFTQALYWYRRAAHQNHDLAVANYGFMLLHGQGVQPDRLKGARLLRMAGFRGIPDAQFAYAVALEFGLGQAADDVKAYAWYSLTSQQYPAKVRKALDRIYQRLSASELQNAHAEARFLRDRIRALASNRDQDGSGSSAADAAQQKKIKAVQWALIWTGHYTSRVDGDAGRYTVHAIRQWQKRHGHTPTGRLTALQQNQLISAGDRIRQAMNWQTYRNGSVGYQIGYPAAVFSGSRPLAHGGRKFLTERRMHHLKVIVHPVSGSYSLRSLYDSWKARMSVESEKFYSAIDENWFVISGRRNRKGDDHYFYIRVDRRATALVGYRYQVPSGGATVWGRATIAMFNSFKVDATVKPATTQDRSVKARPKPKPRTHLSKAQFADGKTGQIEMTSGTSRRQIKPQDLFEEARRTVYIVKAKVSDGISQGSAVAISGHHLLTNCHVVSKASVIIINQGSRRIPAYLHAEDAKADRCVLAVRERLPFWARVRSFADLKIGERVYAIGAPRGLSLTFSDGMISGKRSLRAGWHIQTTAPISPGSSGGGLFDRFGNLIGITTMTLRQSQNLNFAIPASAYYREQSAER